MRWTPICADIQPAFMEQPREDLPGFEPGRVLRIVKGIFGLSEAPCEWCSTLKETLTRLKFHNCDGHVCTMKKSVAEPEPFVGDNRVGQLFGII